MSKKCDDEWGRPFTDLEVYVWTYRRGFIESVGVPAGEFLARADALFRLAPIRQVQLIDAAAVMPVLATSPHLARLSVLSFGGDPPLGDVGVATLVTSPHLDRLTRLTLWGNGVGDAGVRALADSSSLHGLTTLSLIRNRVTGVGVEALASSKNLPSLTHLDLSFNPIDRRLRSLRILRARLGDGLKY